MKRSSNLVLSVLFFVLVFSVNTFSQVSMGLRGGVNFANLDLRGEDVFSFKPKAGVNFAILFNIPLSPVLSLQIEPGFSQRGGRIDEKDEGNINNIQVKQEITGKLLTKYIEMPILFQYKPKIGNLEAIFSLGPEVRIMTGGMKLKEHGKIYVNGELTQDNSNETALNGDDAFRRFDYGLVGGAGLAFPVGTVKLFTEGRYHFGLGNLNSPNDGPKAYNRGASVHVGVLVPIGK